jgi:hypothetical protein
MRIEIHGPETVTTAEECRVRAVLFNDSYEPVAVSRNAFVGPNLSGIAPAGYPHPASVEPTFGQPDEPLTLQPFSFYGRERAFSGLLAGEGDVTATYAEGTVRLTASKPLRIVQGADGPA